MIADEFERTRKPRPRGVFAPTATIFDATGDLDLDAVRQNLAVYAESRLDGVVLLGSNGEFATLNDEEKRGVIAAGAEAIAGRRTVMAGTGAESTRATIALTRDAARLGVDFALVVTPHYYKPRYDHAAYLAHYLSVAEASPIPILIYVMTAYTGVDLPTKLIAELSRHPNIVGIKDSAGNAAKVGEIIAQSDTAFSVLAGSANFLYPALCLGAAGGIVALGNVAPDLCADIYTAFNEGDHDRARSLQMRALAPNAAVTSGHGIAGLKIALEAVGLIGGAPRPPLQPLTEAAAEEVRRVLAEARIGPLR